MTAAPTPGKAPTGAPAPFGVSLEARLPKIAFGSGVYLTDTQGRRYLDGSGGPAVYCLGHAHPEVNEAMIRQLERVAHGYRYLFTSDPLEELTELVHAACGPELADIVFVSGGSEAVESALKLALQFHAARGQMSRRRFIGRRRSWHGNSLGALAVSDFLDRRAPFEGALMPASFVPAVNAYRPPPDCAPGALAEHAARELEDEILRQGAASIAAFIFEPVVGAAGGVVPAPAGYAQRVREVCDRHGVLMIADEVMCGAGRCGTWRALEHDGVVPDLMAIAKGLGGGYAPLGAAVYTRRIAQTLRAAHGGPLTGHTFTGHTLACAAGVAVQRIVRRDGLVERVRDLGPRFQEMLRAQIGDIEQVGDIRGRGFFLGVELVADRSTKAPLPREAMAFQKVGARALEEGLICYPCSGNVDGVLGDTVILAPPYIATLEELQLICELFGKALRAALAEVLR
jgi:adenosylmethionine-8-amino-7-oxononanoate aminotransferase